MSVNKIQEPKVENYPAPKVGLTGGLPNGRTTQEIGDIKNDKIVMKDNRQTFTDIDQVSAESQETMNDDTESEGSEETNELATAGS